VALVAQPELVALAVLVAKVLRVAIKGLRVIQVALGLWARLETVVLSPWRPAICECPRV